MLRNTTPSTFLDQEPEELERFLLRLARQDVAPVEAHERALLNVAAAAAGLGLLAGGAALGSGPSLLKATGWLVAKWLVVGLGSGLLTVAVAQGVSRLGSGSSHGEPAHAARVARLAPVARAAAPASAATSITPESDAPAAAAASAAPSAAFALLTASAPDPAPSPPRPAATASASANTSALTRELALLEQARGALARHFAAQALQALDAYALAFPGGALHVEAAALRIEAIGQSGNRARAAQLADAFLVSYPTSPLSARVRAFANTLSEPIGTP